VIRLVVQGDDLGMCRAVNEGIELAHADGILTQTSVMAPTPWFAEGAAMARRRNLPTGLHVTLTCEWAYCRWSPLTAAASLRGDDGTFKRTVADAKTGDPAEAVVEAHAQADRAEALGLRLTYVDPHMGVSLDAAYEAMCARLSTKFMYDRISPHFDFASLIVLSLGSFEDRPGWFADQLDRLPDGDHMVMAHPGVAGPELQALTDPGAPDHDWAERIRVADLDALCAPEVRAAVERKGIKLIAAQDI
jgi:predicted glycoside hydrolase/deacetylase ChbG (UPF0249 family)